MKVKISKKILIKTLMIIFVLLLMAFVVFKVLYKPVSQVEEQVSPVTIVKPVKANIQSTYNINGYIESETMVMIHPKVSGNIVSFLVDIGDRVKKGDVICQINDAPYRLQYDQANAAYTGIKKIYERGKISFKNGVISQQEWDEISTKYEAYRSQLELAKLQVDYARITAPVNGTILQKYVSAGQVVSSTVGIIAMGDLDNLIVKAKIPEDNFIRFKRSIKKIAVQIKHPADDKVFKAKIDKMSEMVEPQSKSFTVICKLVEGTEFLRPGMFINILFILDNKDGVYRLPLNCLNGGDTLWSVDIATMRAKKYSFKPIFMDDNYFQINDGYKDLYFIQTGKDFIYDGQPVNILNKEEYFPTKSIPTLKNAEEK